jgi:Ca2+-dependent lipid-binding protein
VTVLRAENLVPSDYNGKGDPFVVLRMNKTRHYKKETKVIPKNLNPVWNHAFHFFVVNAVQDMLIVEVWDKDTFGKVLPFLL